MNDEQDWNYSPLYCGPRTDTVERFHPILQAHLVHEKNTEEVWNSYREFKVTKLPRGGTEDCFDFQPKKNFTTKDKRSKKSDEQFHQEQVEAFKKKEDKLVNASFNDTNDDLD